MSLRLGVLGAGMIASGAVGFLPNLKAIRDKVEVVAIADVVPGLASAVATTFGIPAAFTSLDAMLAGAAMDAVLNLTPIPAHGETCLRILAAGKHLATEKPLATTMDDADRICELAQERGLTVVCAPYNMLYPDRAEARRLVREGAIGKVAFARVRSSHGGPASGAWPADPSWFYQKGAGPLFDMGVYGIHEITGILGPAQRVVAFAGITEPTRTVRGGPFQGKTIDVTADDNVLMMLDFGASTFAVVDGTFNVNAGRGPKLEIFGREGTINLSGRPFGGEGPVLEIFQVDAPGWVTPELPDGDAVLALHRAVLVDHLADCVRTGAQPVLNLEHARHVLEIMLKADESASSGRAMELSTTFSLPDGCE
ncbi:putative dehydrogenase [Kribbella antiqua]|uniref:Putative dehydrogenase n=1 Tax=Kribbella antiqua TaxID=2512217 RepID=A0A4R2IXW0_9ACTN|nr:Gfo/Idh/MocA family oxidoreductase [Kribbella antiqua]TCO50394.1 putative dehydrogenase [Kribbella antiqua]